MKQANVIKKFAITEKAARIQPEGKYIFLVDQGANKPEIKKAVEKQYRVHVVAVQTTNQKAKMKRFGAKLSPRPRYKKATVTLKEGEKITIE